MKNKTLAMLLLSAATCLAGCAGNSESVGTTAASTETVNTTVVEKTTIDDTTEATQETIFETEIPATDSIIETTSDLSGIFESEVPNQTYNASPVTFNIGGIKYTVPSDYMVVYFDDIGPVTYINNVFQMKFVKKEASFADVIADIDSLDDKAINAGGTSVIEPTTKEIGGKTFAYFVVDIDGDKTMGILTEGPDGNASIGGQVEILSKSVKYDDLLNMYASIAASASATTDADSTKEEISSQIKYITGEKRKNSALEYKSATVLYNVPDGFFYTAETTGVTSGTQFFESADMSVFVSIEEKAFPEDTAENSIDVMVEYEENTVKQVEEVNGKTAYICINHYTGDSGKVFYNLTCKMDINDEYTYAISADCVDKGDISFETVRKFCEFEVK